MSEPEREYVVNRVVARVKELMGRLEQPVDDQSVLLLAACAIEVIAVMEEICDRKGEREP